MFHEKIKSIFQDSVHHVVSDIAKYAVNPEKDFTREKKISAEKLISFLVSQGSASAKLELLDFFGVSTETPTDSALNQQRAKLRPEALESVFKHFHSSVCSGRKASPYRFIAADGSGLTFTSRSCFASPEYYVSEGHSAKGYYSMHLNAFYDLDTHTYTDALIQPVHQKNEFRAFCDMVDRQEILPGTKNVYIGDRGYCSYNNMAHVAEQGQYFLFRTKDIHSQGLVHGFALPDEESFDITVKVTLVRSLSKKNHSFGRVQTLHRKKCRI